MGNALSKGKKEVVSEVWELRCPYCVPTREIKNLPKTRSRFRKWFEKNPAPSPATEEVSVGPSIRNQLWEGFVTSHGRPGGSAAIPLRTGTGVRNPAYVLAWRTELETRWGGGAVATGCRRSSVQVCWLPLPRQTVATAVWWFVSVILKFGSPCHCVKKRVGVANEGRVFLKGL